MDRIARFIHWPGAWTLVMLAAATALSGCSSPGFYTQAIRGQYDVLAHRRPIDRVIAETNTPPSLREKLRLVLELRAFARDQLQLPVGDQYSRYVDLHRPFVVWNVHAAPAFSLRPKKWWYPVVGRLNYRGYFSEEDARTFASRLTRNHYDVYVEGVEAYSTLGWFSDPVLNTFIHHNEMELAEILFHELAHQRFFARGDTDFNEAFATAVAEEGVQRWLNARGDPSLQEEYARHRRRQKEFVDLVLQTRDELAQIYGESGDEAKGTSGNSKSEKDRRASGKAAVSVRFSAALAGLRRQWGLPPKMVETALFREINNAHLNTVATYYRLVPAFAALLRDCGGDLEEFYRRIKSVRRKTDVERRKQLDQALVSNPPK